MKYKSKLLRVVCLSLVLWGCAGEDNKTTTDALVSQLMIGNNQSSEAPELNDLTLFAFNLNENQRVFKVGFSFKNNPKSPTTIRAYIGKSDLINLSSNGIDVAGYMKENLTPDLESPNQFTFVMQNLPISYKILVVAVNSSGFSAKSILGNGLVINPPVVPPVQTPGNPTGECAGSISAPTTIGNCTTGHCIEVTKNGSVLEFKAKQTTTSEKYYISVDIGVVRLSGVPLAFSFNELYDEADNWVPLPIGQYVTSLITYNFANYDKQCVEVNSFSLNLGVGPGKTIGEYSDNYIFGKIRVP